MGSMCRLSLVVFVLVVLVFSVVGFEAVRVHGQTQRPLLFSGILFDFPLNSTYSSNFLTLNITSKSLQGTCIDIALNYSIDGIYQGIINTTTRIEPIMANITYANGTITTGPSIMSPNVTRGYTSLPYLPEGAHNLTVYAKYEYPNTNRYVSPYPGTIIYYENSTIYFTIDLNPTVTPKISFISLENKTYNTNSVPLTFYLDKAWSNITYCLDNQTNTTLTTNSTLSDLTDGLHSIIIYATDTNSNIAKSDTILFAIKTNPNPTTASIIQNFTSSPDPVCSPSSASMHNPKTIIPQTNQPYLTSAILVVLAIITSLTIYNIKHRTSK